MSIHRGVDTRALVAAGRQVADYGTDGVFGPAWSSTVNVRRPTFICKIPSRNPNRFLL